MRVGSLFSGVGGFDLGLEQAGHEVVWQVEYDRQARSVLRRHWDADIYSDVRCVGGKSDGWGPHRATLAPVDLVCGGFPCQDLSVAGKRAGLDGSRSGLWFEFLRIVAELTPSWVLIENVPGLRSSGGGWDLSTVIGGLAGIGYVGAWRSVDSRYFGLAQRRERVFLLACRDSGAGCPAEVLAIAEGVSGHPAPGRAEGARVAAGSQGGFGDESGRVAPTLNAHYGDKWGLEDQNTLNGGGMFVPAYAFKASHYTRGKDGAPSEVAPPLSADADRGDQDILAFTAESVHHDGVHHDGVHHPLRVQGTPAVYRKAQKAHDAEDCERWEEAERSNTLAGHSTTSSEIALAPLLEVGARTNGDGKRDGDGIGKPGDPMYTLQAGKQHGVTTTVPRRLTPRECERLQGFPDDWTRWGHDGSEMKDSPRYRMLGNAVSVPVARWIGERISPEVYGAFWLTGRKA